MLNLFLFVTLLLAAFMTLIFVIAMRIDDNSIVDIAYGLAFVLVGWSAYLIYATGHARQQLLLGLITIWGLRLASHIFVRKLNEDGEDARYRKWRKSWGELCLAQFSADIHASGRCSIFCCSAVSSGDHKA